MEQEVTSLTCSEEQFCYILGKNPTVKEWDKLTGEAVESWSVEDLKPDMHVYMVNIWTLPGHIDILNILVI